MAKRILELALKVSGKTHKKVTKTGMQQYHYGAISIHNPELVKYIGKKVRVVISESESL